MKVETESGKLVVVPDWMAEMEFCHISPDEDGIFSYCGGSGTEGEPPDCPGEYDGEAICLGCGLPVCPRCAQLSDLEDALEDAWLP